MSAAAPRQHRLFFALWPRPPQQQQLSEAAASVLGRIPGARAVPPGNLHLTLAFLGSVSATALAPLRELAAGARLSGLAPAQALELTLDQLQYWPRAKLVCAVPGTAPEALAGCAQRLTVALIEGGFRPDLKPFRAHVTLARQVERAPSSLAMPAVRWAFDDFALIESRTDPGGSLYSVVDSWPLYGA